MANQLRNYCMTINNPTQSDEEFNEYLKKIDHIKYFIFAREKGDGTTENPDGTIHLQIYLEFELGKTFATMKKYFSTAHIEPREGTKKQARDYILKVGNYAEKAHTRIGEIFEYGTFAEERERTDITDIIQMVKDGATDEELEYAYPTQMFRYSKSINEIRQRSMQAEYKDKFRELEVTYIYGKAGSGKTRYVMEKYGYANVHRVTEYRNSFDNYNFQKVVLFEEFRSSFKIEQLLNYLDGYPLMLPCRYLDKVACFNKVFIISNVPLESQYINIQREQPETWKAVLRRIHYVWNIDSDTAPIKNDLLMRQEFMTEVINEDDLPF